MRHNDYTQCDHLLGTMMEFGRYRLTYEPPAAAVEAEVSLSISSDASLTQMLDFFETFLKATGYQIDGRELSLEREAPNFDDPYEPFRGCSHVSGERVPGSVTTPNSWAVCDR